MALPDWLLTRTGVENPLRVGGVDIKDVAVVRIALEIDQMKLSVVVYGRLWSQAVVGNAEKFDLWCADGFGVYGCDEQQARYER